MILNNLTFTLTTCRAPDTLVQFENVYFWQLWETTFYHCTWSKCLSNISQVFLLREVVQEVGCQCFLQTDPCWTQWHRDNIASSELKQNIKLYVCKAIHNPQRFPNVLFSWAVHSTTVDGNDAFSHSSSLGPRRNLSSFMICFGWNSFVLPYWPGMQWVA